MPNEFIVKNGLIVGGNVVTSGTITINGALAATQSWVTSQAYLTSASLSGYATQSYVTSAISSLIDAAPAALDTLNELAAALGDDANFSTTITNSIASKQSQLNGTGLVRMSGTSVSYDNTTYLISNFGNIEGEHGYGYPSSDGWYKIAEIVLTSSCQSFNLWGEYRDTGYFDNSHYRIHITARAECDFPTNNESHAINVNMYGSSTNETYFNNNVRVVLTSSSSNYRKYELQYYRATWDTGSWNLQTLGWTTYTTSQTAGTPTGTPRVYYISKFVADNIYAANKISIGTTYSGFAANIAGTTYVIGASVWVNDGYGITNASSPSTGFLPYSDGTLVFNSVNSEKMRIAPSGNVGIGTNSPGYKLEVEGSIGVKRIGVAATSTLDMEGNFNFNANSGYSHVFKQAGSEVVRIQPSGNLGIGTASPTRKLDVNGTSIFRDFTTVVSSNGNPVSNTTWLSTDSGITNIYTGGNSTVQLNSNGVSYFNGGNVGIGTSSPDTPLVVQGGSAGTGGWNRTATLSATYPGLIFNSNGTKWGGMAYDYSAAMRFWVNASNNDIFAGTLAMSILNNGNVGIGTSDPGAKLHVVGNAWINRPTNKVDNNGATEFGSRVEFNNAFAAGSTGYTVFNYPSASVFRIYADYDGNIGGLQPDLQLGLGYLTVKSSGGTIGNVGIGTTAPTHRLTVAGGNVLMFPSDNTRQLSFFSDSYGITASSGLELITGDYIRFRQGSTELARLTTTGLGIGTTTPQKKLDVFGSAGILASFGSNISPGNFAGLHFGYSESYASNDNYKKSALVFERTDNNNHGSNASGKIHFLLNNSLGTSANALTDSVVTIDSDANGTAGSVRMGIGTRNPSTPLHVIGIVQVEGGGSTTFYGTDGSGSYARNFGTQLYTFRDTGGSIITTINTTSGVITTTGGNSSNWNTAYGWGNHASAGYQAASTAITTSNIGSQSVSYANNAGYASEAGQVINQSGQLLRFDNRTISPSETTAGYLQFGFTSWANDNSGPYADYLHLRSYTDGSGGTDNLVMFKKSGIGMRIYQQTFGSTTPYAEFVDVWTTANFTSTNVSNWNTAYGWGNHASAGYLTSETDTLASVTTRGSSTSTAVTFNGGVNLAADTGIRKSGDNWIIGYSTSLPGIAIGSGTVTDKVSISSGGTQRVWFDTNGKVGIGTSTPAEELHVIGRGIFNGGSGNSSQDAVVYITKSTNDDWGLYVNNAGLDYGMYTRVSPSANYAFAIHNGTSWTTRITGDGRIYLNEKDTIASYDGWLRLNSSAHYTSGVYTPYALRNDGAFDNYGGIYGYNTIRARKLQTVNNYTTAALWTESYDLTTTGIAFHISGIAGKFLEMRTNGVLYWENSQVWTASTDGSGSGLDADLLDGQNSTEFLRLLSGGAEASLDSYTDNGIRSVNFTGHSQHLLSWNAGGSTGTVQQLFHYGTPNNGWRIRNKTDNSSWSDWGYVVMASSNQGLISGTIATQSWVGSQSYATTSYVTTQINNLIAGAPGALDTLDELAAALGDDSNFATTVTNSIAGKVSKSGDTMTSSGQQVLNIFHGAATGDFNDALFVKNTVSAQQVQIGMATTGSDGDHHRVSLRAYKGTQALEGVFGIALRQPGSAAHTQRLTLDYLGNLTIGGALTESSSIKLKENVETSEGNLEKVVNLRPVTYNKIGSQTKELGLIAEEVATVYPEFVQYDENGEPVGVNYSRLTAALIGAVKELTQRIETLENNG